MAHGSQRQDGSNYATVAAGSAYTYWIRAEGDTTTADSAPAHAFTGRPTSTNGDCLPSPSEDGQAVLLTATVRPFDTSVLRYGGEVVPYHERARGLTELDRLQRRVVPGDDRFDREVEEDDHAGRPEDSFQQRLDQVIWLGNLGKPHLSSTREEQGTSKNRKCWPPCYSPTRPTGWVGEVSTVLRDSSLSMANPMCRRHTR